MIILTGYAHVNPSDVDEFVADVRNVSIQTRGEKGCLFYGFGVDDASAGRVLMAQRWQDQESLAAHLQTSHAAGFRERWMNRLETDLTLHDAAGGRSLGG